MWKWHFLKLTLVFTVWCDINRSRTHTASWAAFRNIKLSKINIETMRTPQLSQCALEQGSDPRGRPWSAGRCMMGSLSGQPDLHCPRIKFSFRSNLKIPPASCYANCKRYCDLWLIDHEDNLLQRGVTLLRFRHFLNFESCVCVCPHVWTWRILICWIFFFFSVEHISVCFPWCTSNLMWGVQAH